MEVFRLNERTTTCAAASITDAAGDTEAKDTMTTMLVNVGLREDSARRLVEEELSFERRVGIGLAPLLGGRMEGGKRCGPTSVELSAAAKVMDWAFKGKAEPFTDEEITAMTVTTYDAVTLKKAGFHERAMDYCQNKKALGKLLALVFPPESPLPSDPRLARLTETVKEIFPCNLDI